MTYFRGKRLKGVGAALNENNSEEIRDFLHGCDNYDDCCNYNMRNDWTKVLQYHCATLVDNEIPNVNVIREGSITGWINNSFAVMHSGCTSAFEATISQKPLLTYVPNKQELFGDDLPNILGNKIESKEDLLSKVNHLFDSIKSNNEIVFGEHLPEQVVKKIYIDNKELAAEKIIKHWESLSKNQSNFSKSSNWILFKLSLKAMKINGIRNRIFKGLFSGKFNFRKKNFKFPPLDRNDINMRVKKLQDVLGIKKNLECKLLSERTILIKSR